MAERPAVTVVVPIHNCPDTLEELTERARRALVEGGSEPVEILLVDDASTDRTWSEVRRLAEEDVARGIRLDPNGGQVAALHAGFQAAHGPVILTLDADLDSSPEDLPRLLGAVLAGAPAAVGVRTGDRPPLRKLGSRAFNRRARSLGYRYRDIGCGSMALPTELALRIAAAGTRSHGFRFKAVLWDEAPGLVEVPMRSVRRDASTYRVSDLALAWLAFEDEVGSPHGPEALATLMGALCAAAGRAVGLDRRVAAGIGLAAGGTTRAALRARLAAAHRRPRPQVVEDTEVP